MESTKKSLVIRITEKIEIFNDWLYARLLRTQRFLENMGTDELVARNKAYLKKIICDDHPKN